MDLAQQEQEKYEQMWNYKDYRRSSPGERAVEHAYEALGMQAGDNLIDFGCGTGRALLKFQEKGLHVGGVDIAENCLDAHVGVLFRKECLWNLPKMSVMWGYCTDVMEHIPPEKVADVLDNIRRSVTHGAYFKIHMGPDAFGPMKLGKPLHLTLRNPEWWTAKLEACFEEVSVSVEGKTATLVCKKPFSYIRTDMVSNMPRHVINANRESAIARGLPELEKGDKGQEKLAICGGGPSLKDNLSEIRAFPGKVMSLNGAYNYLMNKGINPAYFTLLDAKPGNVEFVKNPHSKTIHYLATQVDPSVFDTLSNNNVVLWHPILSDGIDKLQLGKCPVGGGGTVGLRAIHLAVIMGYKPKNIHLYGYDSCYQGEENHAYKQPMNDGETKTEIEFNKKRYVCSIQMARQANMYLEALKTVHYLGDIEVHGEGIIPDIYKRFKEMQRGNATTTGATS